jgi:mono/diheme cytochrome c family protein
MLADHDAFNGWPRRPRPDHRRRRRLCSVEPTPAAQEDRAGRQIFFTQCHGCHTLGIAGTPIAPDLSKIGARLTREQIERRLRDPRTHEPSARMPKLDLRDEEIRALAQYLSGLR